MTKANDISAGALEPGAAIRKEFPIFATASARPGSTRELSYLDSAATSQKPSAVIERLSTYLAGEHANVHRGAYSLSAEATTNYEAARQKVACFINAPQAEGVVFTRGATESINLVAYSLEDYFSPNDTILLTVLEHHSNIVPWQLLARRRKLRLEYVDISDDGSLDLNDFRIKLEKRKPKLLALTCLANSIGTIVPVGEVVQEAHKQNCRVLLDAAQAVAHGRIDVTAWECDFLAFSGHKVYGPTGIGVLYIAPAMLPYMQPFQGGGEMIETVSLEGSTWAEAPLKFEAGTPAIAEAIALGTALDFLDQIGLERVELYERELFEKGFELLRAEPGVQVYGPAVSGGAQASIISFNVERVHPHDLATIADCFNVQIRAGHHCAMPLMKRLGLQATARASIGVYSRLDDFQALLEAIRHARKVLG